MYLSYYQSLILRDSLSWKYVKKIKHIEKGFQLRSCFEYNDRGRVLLIFLRLIFIGQTICLVFIYSFLFTAPQHENHPSSVTTISTKFFFYKRFIYLPDSLDSALGYSSAEIFVSETCCVQLLQENLK